MFEISFTANQRFTAAMRSSCWPMFFEPTPEEKSYAFRPSQPWSSGPLPCNWTKPLSNCVERAEYSRDIVRISSCDIFESFSHHLIALFSLHNKCDKFCPNYIRERIKKSKKSILKYFYNASPHRRRNRRK